MKTKVILIVSMLTLATQAYAKKNCTSEPKSKWMSVAEFKAKIEKEGYKIRKFKQPGSCYEIYGQNPKGQKVEVYFNPVTAEVVKSELDD
ncbi:MAG: PepSY domain-containing protein [Bdellovibrionales bacterium]